MIYVLWGLSGPLKRIFVDALTEQLPGKTINSKASTRPKKEYDGKEMTHFDLQEKIPEDKYPPRYRYIYEDSVYAINKSQIDSCNNNGQDHFIICHNHDVIRSLKEDYGSRNVKVIFLLFFDIEGALKYINQKHNYQDDIEKRIKKYFLLQRRCGAEDSLFDEILPLYHSNNAKEFEDWLWTKMKEYTNFNEKTSLENKQANTQNKLKENKLTKAFVIMPFKKDLDTATTRLALKKIKDYIVPKDDSEFTIDRVDDPLYENNNIAITENIYEAITSSDFIIADLTDNRPNCYYELGYARGLKKPVFVIASQKTTLEFDEKDKSYLIYDSDKQDWAEQLSVELSTRILRSTSLSYKKK